MGMFDQVAHNFAVKVQQASPDNTNKEVLQYFFIRVFTQTLFFLILVPTALILDIKLSIIITTFITYMLLRRCWGGFHLQNDVACMIVSVIAILTTAWLAKVIDLNLVVVITFYIVAFFIVKWTDVVDSPQKRIIKLRRKFRKQGFMTLIIICIVNIGLFFIPALKMFYNAVFLAVSLEILNLIIGKLMNN